jgi:AcrR family transcriptional regulator
MSPKIIDEEELAARELAIMNAAMDYIREEGIGALTIEKVVARVPYSKGTVYNHFISKEDLLTGLCNYCVGTLYKVFTAAVEFEGNSRERLLALCVAYMLHAQVEPTRFMLVITAKTSSMRERSSEARLALHEQQEQQLMQLFCGEIQKGVDKNELVIPEHMVVQQVAFALWSMAFGTIALLQNNLEDCSIRSMMELERELLNHLHLVMDGLGWKPMAKGHDWCQVVAGCKQRVGPVLTDLDT